MFLQNEVEYCNRCLELQLQKYRIHKCQTKEYFNYRGESFEFVEECFKENPWAAVTINAKMVLRQLRRPGFFQLTIQLMVLE